MRCNIEAELTPVRFAEIGEPYRIFREPTTNLVAIASRMPHLGYRGRELFPDPRPSANRLSVYRESDGILLGVIAVKFPVNDVAFSPDGESVIIGTGSYDGGFFFEGFLLRYNLRTGIAEQLLGPSREVIACRCDENGTLSVLVRPSHEEEFSDDNRDAWNIVIGLQIDLATSPWSGAPVEVHREDTSMDGMMPTEPGDHGFTNIILNPDEDQILSWQQEAINWVQGVQASYYQGIWDLRWLDDSTFAVAANKLVMEVRDIHGGVRQHHDSLGNSVELIQHPQLGLLAHHHLPARRGTIDGHSELWQRSGDQVLPKLRLESPYVFSFDASGHGLALDMNWARSSHRRNLLLNPEVQIIEAVDSGLINRIGPTCLPHGLDTLYFLKREGEETYKNDDYLLWRRQSDGKFIGERPWAPLEWDFCPMVSISYSKEAFLGTGPVYNRKASQQLGQFLELVEIKTGHRLVSIQLEGSPTSLALSDDRQVVVVGFSDGHLIAYELGSQQMMVRLQLSNHGIQSVPLSLAIRGERLLIGTHDGRILLARLTE